MGCCVGLIVLLARGGGGKVMLLLCVFVWFKCFLASFMCGYVSLRGVDGMQRTCCVCSERLSYASEAAAVSLIF